MTDPSGVPVTSLLDDQSPTRDTIDLPRASATSPTQFADTIDLPRACATSPTQFAITSVVGVPLTSTIAVPSISTVAEMPISAVADAPTISAPPPSTAFTIITTAISSPILSTGAVAVHVPDPVPVPFSQPSPFYKSSDHSYAKQLDFTTPARTSNPSWTNDWGRDDPNATVRDRSPVGSSHTTPQKHRSTTPRHLNTLLGSHTPASLSHSSPPSPPKTPSAPADIPMDVTVGPSVSLDSSTVPVASTSPVSVSPASELPLSTALSSPPVNTSSASPSYAAAVTSSPLPPPGGDSSSPSANPVFMAGVWQSRKTACYTLRNMPLTLTVENVIATVSAQLNLPPKSVFLACIRDTRFKERGVFHLRFVSPEILTSLLRKGFSVGGKQIGGGHLKCFCPNFGVPYDATDARNALRHLGDVSHISFVEDANGIRVGGLYFTLLPNPDVLVDLLTIDGEEYDIRYYNKPIICRACHSPGHLRRNCPNVLFSCVRHAITHSHKDCADFVDSDSDHHSSADHRSTHSTPSHSQEFRGDRRAAEDTPSNVPPAASSSGTDTTATPNGRSAHTQPGAGHYPGGYNNCVAVHVDAHVDVDALHKAKSLVFGFEYPHFTSPDIVRCRDSAIVHRKEYAYFWNLYVGDADLLTMMAEIQAGYVSLSDVDYDQFTVHRLDGQPVPELAPPGNTARFSMETSADDADDASSTAGTTHEGAAVDDADEQFSDASMDSVHSIPASQSDTPVSHV